MRDCVRRFAEAIDASMPTQWQHQDKSEEELLDLLDSDINVLDSAEAREHLRILVRVACDCMYLWDNKILGRYNG